MKSAVLCFNCKKMVRLSESYQIKLTFYKEQEVHPTGNGGGGVGVLTGPWQIKVRCCKSCTRKAGYKIGAGKKRAVSGRGVALSPAH